MMIHALAYFEKLMRVHTIPDGTTRSEQTMSRHPSDIELYASPFQSWGIAIHQSTGYHRQSC